MSTHAYYRDRLGFDPYEPMDTSNGPTDANLQGYEENLSKFKGMVDFSSF